MSNFFYFENFIFLLQFLHLFITFFFEFFFLYILLNIYCYINTTMFFFFFFQMPLQFRLLIPWCSFHALLVMTRPHRTLLPSLKTRTTAASWRNWRKQQRRRALLVPVLVLAGRGRRQRTTMTRLFG